MRRNHIPDVYYIRRGNPPNMHGNRDKHNLHTLDDLLFSYIHMFINKLFINEQRKYEFILCHFLSKYYLSQIALQNKII